MNNKCIICFKLIKNNVTTIPQVEICDNCIDSDDIYSRITCLDVFELNLKELDNIKKYYDINKNIYYIRKDIIKLISNQNNISIRKGNIELKEKKRKLDLTNKMKMYKLDNTNNSICRTHIKFGFPTLDETINLLIETQNEENKRMHILLDELEKNDLNYNPTLPCYLNYIQNKCSLKKTLQIAETEIFLANNTEYINLLEKYDNETAKEIALFNYYKNKKSKIKNNHDMIDNKKLEFD